MKNYLLRAEITITEMESQENHPSSVDANANIDRLAGVAAKVLCGGPLVMGPVAQANTFQMTKAVSLSGQGFSTVTETMRRVNEILEQISIDTI